MRIAYTCHDAFPSPSTNTQQTFWIIVEVARLGPRVNLIIPSVQHGLSAGASAGEVRDVVASYYGLPREEWPDGLEVSALGHGATEGSLSKGRFDWRVPDHVPSGSDVVWTRDPVAAARLA